MAIAVGIVCFWLGVGAAHFLRFCGNEAQRAQAEASFEPGPFSPSAW